MSETTNANAIQHPMQHIGSLQEPDLVMARKDEWEALRQRNALLEELAKAIRWHMDEELACPASRKAVLDALAALDEEDGHGQPHG